MDSVVEVDTKRAVDVASCGVVVCVALPMKNGEIEFADIGSDVPAE